MYTNTKCLKKKSTSWLVKPLHLGLKIIANCRKVFLLASWSIGNILLAENAKIRFISRKKLSFKPQERHFCVTILERFNRSYVNFIILIKKRKRKKTLMMLMLEMTEQG